MVPSISKILKSHRVDGLFHSHVSLVQPKGSYQFNRQDLEDFWEIYCDTIYKNPTEIVGIAEKPQEFIPVLVDVDIKVKYDESKGIEQLYTESHVTQVISVYQDIFRDIIDNCNDNHLTCLLLEKSPYKITQGKTVYLKNGFHLHFPYIFLNKIDHEVQLIPRVKEAVKVMEIFKDIGFEDSSELIDKSYCKVRWLLYGSRKGEKMDPYIFSKAYDMETNEISLYESLADYQLFNKQEKRIKITEDNVNHYLPRILSIIPFGRTGCEIQPNVSPPIRIITEKRSKKTNRPSISIKKALDLAKLLLPMLADCRAEEENEWISIGWTLYDISNGSNEGLDLWIKFSKRCPEKFNESVCVYKWQRMRKHDFTIGTLRYYASIDSPEEYKKFRNSQSQQYIKQSLSGSHHDIALALFEEYNTEFICSKYKERKWYQFINHRWREIDEGVFLRKKISEEIVPRYVDMGKDALTKFSLAEEDGEKAMWNTRVKIIQKLIASLGNANFKGNVMKESAEVFYVDDFESKLNKNPYLIAFNNGVYDLKLNKFRSGRPEDHITRKMSIDYDEEMTEEDDSVVAFKDFLEKIFPDESIRKYFVDVSSELFVGGNKRKRFFVWTGVGNNGKSITELILEKMLGPYAIKLPTSLLTGKRTQSSSASAELARTDDGVRLAVVQEPSKTEVINIGVLKELSSGADTYFARDLFQKGKDTKEITPMFKLILICNKPPHLPYDDPAAWNRIRVIPFESIFVEKGRKDSEGNNIIPDSYEEQLEKKIFAMDEDFKDKIPGLVKGCAWYLLEHRKNMLEGIIEPEKVKLATAAYRETNDLYRQFIEENIKEDDNAIMYLAELYTTFKKWFSESMPHHTLPTKKEVREYFIDLWGKPCIGISWPGYRIRTLQDDINSGDAVVINREDCEEETDIHRLL